MMIIKTFKFESPRSDCKNLRLLGQRLYKAGLNFNAQYPVILGISK